MPRCAPATPPEGGHAVSQLHQNSSDSMNGQATQGWGMSMRQDGYSPAKTTPGCGRHGEERWLYAAAWNLVQAAPVAE